MKPATGTATGTATPRLTATATATAMYFIMYLYGGRSPPYNQIVKYMAVAVAVAVSGGVAVPVSVSVSVAVPVAGLTKRFFNQKDFLINVWGQHGCRCHHC